MFLPYFENFWTFGFMRINQNIKLIGRFPGLECKCNDQREGHPLKKIHMRILAAHSW